MKKFSLILILVSFSQLSISQSKWSVGLYFEPGSGGLAKRYEHAGFDDSVRMYNGPRTSYIIGGLVNFRLNDRIRFSTGLYFKEMSFALSIKRDYYPASFNETFSKIDPNVVYWQSTTFTNYFYFWSVPATIQYSLITSNKLNVYVNTGVTANFMFKSSSTTDIFYDYGTENRDTSIYRNQYFFSLSFGAGINYSLSNQFCLFLEPCGSYFLRKAENPYPIEGHFYNLGVKFGVLYSL
jgi:hypothetical protein